jgi:glutaredoxin
MSVEKTLSNLRKCPDKKRTKSALSREDWSLLSSSVQDHIPGSNKTNESMKNKSTDGGQKG